MTSQFSSVQDCLNQVGTELAAGSGWHRKAALSALMNGYRGLKRWHVIESQGDDNELLEFELYLADNYRLEIEYDGDVVSKAMEYSFGKSDLDSHLTAWMDRERNLIGLLEDAIQYLSEQKYYTIYKMLCEILAGVENEYLYIKILKENLEFAEYGKHHVMVVMHWLHEYFKDDWDGGRIDFSIE